MSEEKSTTGAETNQAGEEENVVLSKQELDKKLQSETDKRVTEALKTHREKWEQDFEAKLKKEVQEAEKLAKLSEEEKQKVLAEQKDRELTERETRLKRQELKFEAINQLEKRSLPIAFADTVIGDDANETLRKINEFESKWKDELEKNIDQRLKGSTPKQSTKTTKINMNEYLRGYLGKKK